MTENRERDDHTVVDLGDDLAEKTAAVERPKAQPPPVEATPVTAPAKPANPENDEDALQTARILLSEGLIEDAKVCLRRLLVANPRDVAARKMLAQAHDAELKRLLSDEPLRKARGTHAAEPAPPPATTEILRDLEKDLGLEPEPLLADEATTWTVIERALVGANARDCIDLGIAFLEMDLSTLAQRVFRMAGEMARNRDPERITECALLLGTALIASGDAFGALILAEQFISDVDLSPHDRAHFLHLAGVCATHLKRPDEAARWFAQAAELDPLRC